MYKGKLAPLDKVPDIDVKPSDTRKGDVPGRRFSIFDLPPLDMPKCVVGKTFRLPGALMDCAPVDAESMFPAAKGDKPDAVDPRIKELQREVREERKKNVNLQEKIKKGEQENVDLRASRLARAQTVQMVDKEVDATENHFTEIERQRDEVSLLKSELKNLKKQVNQELDKLWTVRDANTSAKTTVLTKRYLDALAAGAAED